MDVDIEAAGDGIDMYYYETLLRVLILHLSLCVFCMFCIDLFVKLLHNEYYIGKHFSHNVWWKTIFTASEKLCQGLH